MSDTNKADDFLLDLDMDLSEIEDLPDFAVWPTGSYLVEVVTMEKGRELKDKLYIAIDFKLLELLEVNEKHLKSGESVPKVGDIQSMLYGRENKFAAGALKKLLVPFGEQLGLTKIGDILEQIKGMKPVIVQTRRTKNKDGEDRDNVRIENVLFA